MSEFSKPICDFFYLRQKDLSLSMCIVLFPLSLQFLFDSHEPLDWQRQTTISDNHTFPRLPQCETLLKFCLIHLSQYCYSDPIKFWSHPISDAMDDENQNSNTDPCVFSSSTRESSHVHLAYERWECLEMASSHLSLPHERTWYYSWRQPYLNAQLKYPTFSRMSST